MAAVSSVAPVSSPRTMKRRYSDLRGRPSSKTTIEPTTWVPCTWLMSKHSMRSGASSSSRVSWSCWSAWLRVVRSPARVTLCRARLCLALRATVSIRVRLSPRRGTRRSTRLPRRAESHSDEGLGVVGQHRHEHLARHGVAGLAAVDLLEQVLDDLGRGLGVTLGHPAALAAHPAAAHVEELHRDLELVLGQGEDVGVGGVGQHHGRLLEHPLERPDVVAQPGGPLEVELGGGALHLLGQAGHEPAGLTGHEVAEVLGDLAVARGVDPADARGAALVDVAEQAGPADLAGPLEHPGGAGAHREDPQREVEGLADRPGVRVGAEVPGALALGAAHDLGPRVLLAQGHREVRVGLVVAVLDVEPRVELLDPRVLELERLDLGADDGPLDAGPGAHHGRGAVVQGGDVLEVGGQPLPQVLGLADVDDPPVLVAEPVDPGVGRDLPRSRTVRRRVSHAATLRPRTVR